jgi:hypothetical protein
MTSLVHMLCSSHKAAARPQYIRLLEKAITFFKRGIYNCSLFNDGVTDVFYIASNDWMIVDNDLQGMWKENVVT